MREGHEIANHMWDHHIPPTLEEEAVHIDRTDTLIKGLTGQYPAGTRSEHDLAALRDHAYTYVSYTPQGEFPFYVYYENIGKWMLNLPISFIHDDAMFFYSDGSEAATSSSASSPPKRSSRRFSKPMPPPARRPAI